MCLSRCDNQLNVFPHRVHGKYSAPDGIEFSFGFTLLVRPEKNKNINIIIAYCMGTNITAATTHFKNYCEFTQFPGHEILWFCHKDHFRGLLNLWTVYFSNRQNVNNVMQNNPIPDKMKCCCTLNSWTDLTMKTTQKLVPHK
jgi:hypothetical protein